MKKIVFVILFCIFISVPVSADSSFSELCKKNTCFEILNRHSSAQITVTFYYDDAPVFHSTKYVSPEVFSEFNDDNTETYIDNQSYFITTDAAGNGTADDIVDVLLEDDAAYMALLQDCIQNQVLSADSTEKLKNTTANDGILSFETEIKDGLFIRGFKKWLTEFLEYGAEHGSYGYEDGMTAKFEYHFDENTSDVIEWTCILCEKNGTEHLYKKVELIYDTPYDPAMIPHITSFMESENLRNVTIFYADGQAVTKTVPKGVYIDVMVGGENPEYLYLDETYTEDYKWKNDDLETDVELYLK